MMSCREVTALATEHMEGRLSGGRSWRLRLHLAMCRGCRAYLQQLAVVATAAREHAAAPMPEALRQRVLAQFQRWKTG